VIFAALILIIALVVLPTVNVARAGGDITSWPKVFVNPTIYTATDSEETFTVDVEIANVSNMQAFDFKFGYNTAILDALEVTEGSFLKDFGPTFPVKLEIDETLGSIWVVVALLGQTSAEGDGTLATISFKTASIGECPFDLYDTMFINADGLLFNHCVTDGYSLNSEVDPPSPEASATPPTQAEIDAAIDAGMAWLAAQQNSDGSWGWGYQVAKTGFAVLKFATHAIHQCIDPLGPTYLYYDQVRNGLDYIFANAYTAEIYIQPAGNPDTDGNGLGVCLVSDNPTYETGIAMMAIAATTHPEMIVNVPTSAVNGWTYKDVLSNAVDYLAFGQNDDGAGRGGWGYAENQGWSDNSNTGYAVLGLAYAEVSTIDSKTGFNCTIPEFVKSELNIWVDYIQNGVNGDPNDGGSGYAHPEDWVNILKTGNLLFEMAFIGDTKDTPRAIDAVDYIERHWNDLDGDPGWRGWPETVIAHKQAMYTTMKGFEALGIETIIVDSAEVDYFDEMSSVLLQQQNPDGSWDHDYWGDEILGTEWTLLTLQKTVPSPPPSPHDVAITDVAPSKTSVYQGEVLPIEVTVENQGDFAETFVVIAYYDGGIITPEHWDIFAHMGDVDRDGYISMTDYESIVRRFGWRGTPGGIPEDLNHDGRVDVIDIFRVARNYGLDIWTYFGIQPPIGTQTVNNLSPRDSATLAFEWNTADVVLGNYILSAYATPVPEETHKADNNYVDGEVTVCVMPVTIDIDPDTLNTKSNGEWITAYIELPEGYNVADIDLATVLLTHNDFQLPAETDPQYGFVTDPESYLMDHDHDGVMERMVKFDRIALRDHLGEIDLDSGEKFYDVTLIVSGKVAGISFEGTDTIVVIKK